MWHTVFQLPALPNFARGAAAPMPGCSRNSAPESQRSFPTPGPLVSVLRFTFPRSRVQTQPCAHIPDLGGSQELCAGTRGERDLQPVTP